MTPLPNYSTATPIFLAVSQRLTFARTQLPVGATPNPAVERDRRQASLAGSLRASRSGGPSPLR